MALTKLTSTIRNQHPSIVNQFGDGGSSHGLGMEGALEAARDLVSLWNEEKRARSESITTQTEAILATVEVA